MDAKNSGTLHSLSIVAESCGLPYCRLPATCLPVGSVGRHPNFENKFYTDEKHKT